MTGDAAVLEPTLEDGKKRRAQVTKAAVLPVLMAQVQVGRA